MPDTTTNTATTPKVDAGNIIGGIGGLVDVFNTSYSTYANVQDAKDWKGQIYSQQLNSKVGDIGSFDEWEGVYNSTRPVALGLNRDDVGFNTGSGIANTVKSSLSGASTGLTVGGPWGAVIGGFAGLSAGLAGFFTGKSKADKTLREIEATERDVNNRNRWALRDSLYNIKDNMYDTLEYNYIAAEGGPLSTQGSDWSTGLTYVGSGGSHEQNPNGGIQMGIAPDGLPNLVEEGEVIWNGDYVFSKRLKVPKAFREKFKLGEESISYADAALKFDEEMDERPNDPISKRGREVNLSRLARSQEEKRAKIAAKEETPQESIPQEETVVPEEQIAAKGGPIGHRFDYAGWFDNRPEDYTHPWLNPEDIGPFDNYDLRLKGLDKASFLTQPGGGLPAINTKLPVQPQLNLRQGGLGKEYYDWLAKMTDGQYAQFLSTIYPNKGKTKANYNKYLQDRAALFNEANRGKPGPIYGAITDAALGARPSSSKTPRPFLEDSPFLDGQRTDIRNTEWYRGLPVVSSSDPATGAVVPLNARNNTSDVATNTGVDHSHPVSTSSRGNNNRSWQTYLRYAPALGSAIGVISDLFTKPDYSNADAVLNAARSIRDVRFSPIGNYLRYTPLDRMFYLNQLNANAGATRRAMLNSSAGNRGTAMAGILAADNNMMNGIGQLARQAEEYNMAQRQKVAEFNRATNMFNSEGSMKAQQANQGADEVRMRAAQAAAQMREAIDQRIGAARSANLTNFFDNLGNIGREEFMLNSINSNNAWNYLLGRDGILDYKGYPVANGGYITIKNKRRRK